MRHGAAMTPLDAVGIGKPWNAEARREPVVLRSQNDSLILSVGAVWLVALGVVMVLNTSYFYAQEHFADPYLFTRKHLVAGVIGLVSMLLFWRIPTHVLRRATYPLLLVSLVLLAL